MGEKRRRAAEKEPQDGCILSHPRPILVPVTTNTSRRVPTSTRPRNSDRGHIQVEERPPARPVRRATRPLAVVAGVGPSGEENPDGFRGICLVFAGEGRTEMTLAGEGFDSARPATTALFPQA